MTTTRRYPRTSAEAFRGLDYSCAIERPMPSGPRLAGLPFKALALLLGALLLLLLVGCATTSAPDHGGDFSALLAELACSPAIVVLCALVMLATGAWAGYMSAVLAAENRDRRTQMLDDDSDAGDTHLRLTDAELEAARLAPRPRLIGAGVLKPSYDGRRHGAQSHD